VRIDVGGRVITGLGRGIDERGCLLLAAEGAPADADAEAVCSGSVLLRAGRLP
jgi:hypothetical protein